MSAGLVFRALVRAIAAMAGFRWQRYAERKGALTGLFTAFAMVLLAGPGVALAANDSSPGAARYDISFPDCRGGYTPATGSMIIGVTGGRAFTKNPCLVSQLQASHSRGEAPALYMNLNSPHEPGAAEGNNGPRGVCQPRDQGCRSYNFGYHAARYADQYARSQSASPHTWWLDIETANYWSPDTGANAQVIQGAIDYLRQHGTAVGIYSIAPMWHKIAGGFAPKLPNWVAQTRAAVPTLSYCSTDYAFGGGTVALVQHWDGTHDVDYACGSIPRVIPRVAAPAPDLTPALTNASNVLGAAAAGTLVGSTGGSSAFYTFDYWGGNKNGSVMVTFSPHGQDVTNGFFVILSQHGQQLAKIHASDFRTPGQIEMDFSSASSGPMTVQLVNYNDPKAAPPIAYTITRQQK